MIKDIICGMQIDELKTSTKSNYQGKDYYFCSLVCKERFDSDPGKYVKREKGYIKLKEVMGKDLLEDK